MDWKLILAIVLSSTVVVTCVALVTYLYFIAPELKSVHLQTSGTDVLKPGDKITINIKSRAIKNVRIQLSTNGGKLFNSIVDKTNPRVGFEYTIPRDVFSDTCIIRVEDIAKTSRSVDSEVFSVIPEFSMRSDITKKNVHVYIPGSVIINYFADTTLISNQNVQLEISTDGTTWEAVTEHFVVDSIEKKIVWNVTAGFQGSYYIRAITTNLKAKGYKSELMMTTPLPILFILGSEENPATGGAKFKDLKVRHAESGGNSGNVFTPGTGIYLTYEVKSGTPDTDKLIWEYRINSGKYEKMKDVFLVDSNTYQWEIPSGIQGTIGFKLTEGTSVSTKDYDLNFYMDLVSASYMSVSKQYQVTFHTHGSVTEKTIKDASSITLVNTSEPSVTWTFDPDHIVQLHNGYNMTLTLLFKGKKVTDDSKFKLKFTVDGVETEST